MIEVRMSEDNRVDPFGVDREGGPVPFPQFLQPLEKSAIHQNQAAIKAEQMLRAGNGAGGAEERQRRHPMTILEVMGSIRSRTIDRRSPTGVKESPVEGLLRRLLIGLLIVGAANFADAQQRLLTIDDIYDPVKRVDFSGNPAPAITWIDGTHYTQRQNGSGGTDWLKVDAATG